MASLAQINIRFRAELSEFEREMKRAKSDLKRYGNDLKKTGTALSTYLTAPLAAFGATSLMSAANFEAAMKNVQAITGATAGDLELLSQTAQDLGKSTQFSASQAADAMAFLGMAGFETSEIIAAIPEVLNLAAAGSLELARAADIASNIMGQFGISADNTGRVTNILAATASSANTNVDQLAEAMKYLGPTAQSLGISVEEAAGVIGVLGDAGLQGSMAGRALASSLVRLSDPTTKMSEAMQNLGLQVFDAGGNFVGMQGFLEQLQQGIAEMSQEQRAANLNMLLGAEAFQEINILLERGSAAYGDYVQSITDTNRASEMAATKMEGLKAVGLEIASAFEYLQIAVGESGLTAWATQMGKSIADLLRSIGDLNPTILKTVTILGGLAAAAGPVLFTMGVLSSSVIPAIITGITALTAAVAANPFGALAVAATAAAGAFGLLSSSQTQYTSQLATEQAELNGMVLAIQQTNVESRQRAALLDQLKNKYPDFLKDLNTEKVSNEQLQSALEGVNKEYERRIIVQAQEKQLSDAYQDSAEKLQAVGRARVELSKKLVEASKIEGVEIDRTKNSYEAAKEVIEQLEQKRRELARGKSEVFSFDEFASTQAQLGELVRELEAADQAYQTSSQAVVDLKAEQQQLLDSILSTTEAGNENTTALELQGQSLESLTEKLADLKRAQQVVGTAEEYDQLQSQIDAVALAIKNMAPAPAVGESVADLKAKIDELKEAQDMVTSPEQWQNYQDQIDKVQQSVDRITAGVRGGLDLSQVNPEVKGTVRMEGADVPELQPMVDYTQLDYLKDVAEQVEAAADGLDEMGTNIDRLRAKQSTLNSAYQIAVDAYGEQSAAAQGLYDMLRNVNREIAATGYVMNIFRDLGNTLQQSFATMPERRRELNELNNEIERLREEQRGVSNQQEWNTLQSEIDSTQERIDALNEQNPFNAFLGYLRDMVAQLLAAIAVAGILSVVLAGMGFGGLFGSGASDIVGSFNSLFQAFSGLDLSGDNNSVPGFATGAYVTGPTLAVVGEGGQNEWVLPENKLQQLIDSVKGTGMAGPLRVAVGGEFELSANTLQAGVRRGQQLKDLWS